VTGNASAVTLAIASQPGSGAKLSCTKNPVTASAGVAAFAGCKITGEAGSYTIKATDGTLTSATSSTFSITG
jgi:trimeric autotransporter adhesin